MCKYADAEERSDGGPGDCECGRAGGGAALERAKRGVGVGVDVGERGRGVRFGGARDSGGRDGDGGASGAYGANNEQLPERLHAALRRLVQQYSTESESTRRQEVRRIKQAHQFWRGLQYLWWNERDQNWHLPFEQKLMDNSSIEDLPRYEFVTNIYQAFGLSLIAVLSQDVPRVRFFPSSAQAEEDVSAAKAATEVAQLVERNNRIGNLIVEEAFNLWTDGKVGAYVRYVVDGQRFGFHPETEIGMRSVRVGTDVYVCPECGKENPRAEKENASGLAAEGDSGTVAPEHGARSCGGCEALLTEEDFVAAEMLTVPEAQTRTRVPNGQEVVTIVGGLALKTPPWADEMHMSIRICNGTWKCTRRGCGRRIRTRRTRSDLRWGRAGRNMSGWLDCRNRRAGR